MDVGLILIFGAVFLCSYLLLSLVHNKRLPPGPWSFPLLGSVYFYWKLQKKRPHLFLLEASRKNGNIFSFKIGTQLVVVLHGYATIHEALVKQGEVFSGRPNFLPSIRKVLKEDEGISFASYNHKWKSLRKLTLLSLRNFGVGKSTLEEKIMEEIEAACKETQHAIDNPLQLSPILHKLAGNILYGIVFGTRFDYNDPVIKMILYMTNTATNAQGPFTPGMFFPLWMAEIMTKSVDKRFRNRKKNLDNIYKLITKQIKDHEESYDEENIRDFVDLYIKMSSESKQDPSSAFTPGNLRRLILELHVAGVETIAKTLDWAFLFMVEHQEIQRKCQQEIEDNIGDKNIQYWDRRSLTFVEATLCETLRLANIAPLALHHCTTKDTTLLGYAIPKNTVVTPSLYSANMDPMYWKDPHVFQPDRFLDDNGNLAKNEIPVPFSLGPRACLGEPLARIILFLVFSNMLQRFSFERENVNKKHHFELDPKEWNSAPYPYKMRIKKRSP